MTDTLEPPARFGSPMPEPPPQRSTSDAKIPLSDRFKSVLFNKPCPRRGVPYAVAMVAEQNRIGHTRPAMEFSAVECTLRNGMEADVNRQIVEDTKTELESTVATVRAKLQEHNTLVRDVERLAGEPIIGPHGETLDTTTAQRRHDDLDTSITADSEAGKTKNRRISPAQRKFVERLVWLDFPLFVYFMASSLNVSITSFYQSVGGVIRMIFAAVFGLFATIAIARGLKFLGANHRAYKDDDGQWAGPPQMRAERLMVFGILAGVAALMGFRIGSDVLESGMGIALAVVVAVVLATASALLNWVVYAAEYKDGSTDTERLDAYAAGLERITRSQQALRALIVILDEEIAKLILEGFRIGGLIRTRNISAANDSWQDAATRYARSVHQGTGHTGDLPAHQLDWSPLDTALGHLNTLEAQFLANQAQLSRHDEEGVL